METRPNPSEYRRVALTYQGLPVTIALALVGVFLAAFHFVQNYIVAAVVAVVPTLFLLWRWGLAGKQIDRWGCPKCGQTFPKKMTWSYPPHLCPHCGDRIW